MKELVLISIFLVAGSWSAVLPDGEEVPFFAKVCHRSEEDVDDCLKESFQTLVRTVSKGGIRQLNFPPLDPWIVKKYPMEHEVRPGYRINSVFSNVETRGFSTMQIHDVRSNLDNPEKITFEVDFSVPKVTADGDFSVRIFVDDDVSTMKGSFKAELVNVVGTFKVRGHLVERDGEDYLMIDIATMYPDVGDFEMSIKTVDERSELLGNIVSSTVNNSWREMYARGRPFVEDFLNSLIVPRINLATLKVPYEQLIPQ